MKMLVCASEYYPHGSGIANVAYNVVEQLKKKGIECTVCSPTGPDIKIGSPKLIQNFGIIGLLYYWYKVSKNFETNDFDVIWMHNPFLLNGSPYKKCVVTLNSTYYGKMVNKLPPSNYNKVVSRIEKFCLNRMNQKAKFTAVGQGICNEMEDSGVNHKINYIPNGVNINKFKTTFNKNLLRKKLELPLESTIILSVGRLVELKRTKKMIEIFGKLQEKLPDITFVIAGDGELFESLVDYTEKYKIKNVNFLGHIKENLPDLYACSDYYITASKYEGGGPTLAIAEAMATGLPCIVSNIQNLKFIEDIDAGIVVDFDKTEEAINKINQYLQKDNSNHSQNAKKYSTNNLNWDLIANQYLEEFKQVCK
ncbi:glycosyltransferase family 4 protein [Methanococcoides orientis]|uniref:glycosyltransferase family 4 protein n=1 Tax=Methanococcoides orientis TaxID=2822137 RepID=UPI001E5BD94D|nr:glycosyltransferase family 4 protein [Methanococcoides orientis]UGV40036.1 glycosyltransferase family 4 protein [Methanococcoides orientis]